MKRNIKILLALSLCVALLSSCAGKQESASSNTDSKQSLDVSSANDTISQEQIESMSESKLPSNSPDNPSNTSSKGNTSSKSPSNQITTIKPETYGAKADGKTNCTKAFSQAISACRNAEGASVLQLSAGTYLFDKDPIDGKNYTVDYSIFLHQMSNFTLQGSTTGTTTIMIKNPSIGGLSIEDGNNIAIKNITIDYSVVPYVQGTVVSADANTGKIILDIDTGAGFPSFDDALFRGDVMTSTYGTPADNSKDLYGPEAIMVDDNKPFEKISGNRWQINVKPESCNLIRTANLQKGSRYIQEAHRWVYGMKFYRNKDVSVENVTVYAGPATVTTWGMNENVTVRGLRVDVKPDSNRELSTLADCIHGFGNRGKFLVEKCYFHGNSDDGINLHCRAGFITEVVSNTKIKVNPSGTNDYRVGDEIQVVNTVEKTIRGKVKLKAVEQESTYSYILTFDKPVAGMVYNADQNKTDTIYNASSCSQNAIIQNNTFNSNRGRHIVLRSHGVTIKNNTFNIGHGTWTSVLLEFAQDWGEGPAPYDINVLNNTFNDLGDTRGNKGIQTYTMNNIVSETARTIKNINIEGNKFNNMTYVVMDFNGTSGITLKNNEINVSSNKVTSSLIQANNCSGIKIDGLTGKDPNPKSKTPALISLNNNCVKGTAGYTATAINFNFTNAQKPVILEDMR